MIENSSIEIWGRATTLPQICSRLTPTSSLWISGEPRNSRALTDTLPEQSPVVAGMTAHRECLQVFRIYALCLFAVMMCVVCWAQSSACKAMRFLASACHRIAPRKFAIPDPARRLIAAIFFVPAVRLSSADLFPGPRVGVVSGDKKKWNSTEISAPLSVPVSPCWGGRFSPTTAMAVSERNAAFGVFAGRVRAAIGCLGLWLVSAVVPQLWVPNDLSTSTGAQALHVHESIALKGLS